MKDNKIDILFKKKLQGLEKSPRPVAWDKIHSQITKDKLSIVWWHRAAIIVLLCLSGVLIFYKKDDLNNKQPEILSDSRGENTLDQTEDKVAENDSHDSYNYSKKLHADALKEENSPSLRPKATKPSAKITKDLVAKTDTASGSDQYMHEDKENGQYQSNHSTIADASIFKEEAEIPIKDTPPVTIEFRSRKRTVEKPLLTDNSLESITEDHSSFTLKKLMTKVKDIKESEISLADLRQAKDNLFAFDTYKETFKSTEK